jgi:hypothetical protein
MVSDRATQRQQLNGDSGAGVLVLDVHCIGVEGFLAGDAFEPREESSVFFFVGLKRNPAQTTTTAKFNFFGNYDDSSIPSDI